jgi:hypothetical protein
MKQINRLLIMLTLLCILCLVSSGVAAADSVIKLHANNGSNVVTDYAFPAGLSSMVGTISHIPIAPDASSVFGGWYTLENLDLDPSGVYLPIGSAAPTGDLISDGEEYYAVWVATSSTTVKLHANNGTSLFINYPFTHGSDISSIVYIPDYPGAEVFMGWYKLEDLVSDPYGLGILAPSASAAPASGSLANGAEYYAVWEIHSARFYENDGGTWNTVIPFFPVSSSTIESIPSTGFLAPAGSVFQGWYKLEDLEPSSINYGVYVPSISGAPASGAVIDDGRYYAVWGYNMGYYVDLGTTNYGSSSPAVYYLGEDPDVFVADHLSSLSFGDWDLVGWYDSSFTNEWGDPSFTFGASTTTLHAKLTGNVTLDANGGEFSGGVLTYDIEITPATTISEFMTELGSAPALQAPTGWTADSDWYFTVSASGVVDMTSAYDSTFVPDPTSTLYAVHQKSFAVHANGPDFFDLTQIAPITAQYNHDVNDIKDLVETATGGLLPTHGSWTHDGWYLGLNAPEYVDISSKLNSPYILGNLGVSINDIYMGWFGDINLYKNDGSTFSPVVYTVQPGQTYSDIESDLDDIADTFAADPFGDWVHDGWYTHIISQGYVNTVSIMSGGATFAVGDSLYLGWFGDINLDENGGTGISATTLKVQPGQPYSDIETSLNSIASSSSYGSWTADWWYLTPIAAEYVDISSLVSSVDTFNVGDTLYIGWFGDINLDANGGIIPGSLTFEVQPGQPYSDIETALYISADVSNVSHIDGWNARVWYKDEASGIVDEADRLLAGDTFIVGDTLYVGWFGDITFNANGGSFALVSDPYDYEVQAGQTYADIESDLLAELGTIDHNDGWTDGLWYTDADAFGIVDESDRLVENNPLIKDSDLFVGWFGEITLDANGGEFGLGSGNDIARIKIQAGQTYGDLLTLITISQTPPPENGAWTQVPFYKTVSSGIVDTSSFLDVNDWGVLSTPMPVSETLYIGWFSDVFLDANGGEFGSGSSVFRIPIEVQFGQTYGDLVPLIAAELAGNAPEYGRLIPKMWYLTQISGNVPYVDTSSFLDLTDSTTLSILADGNEIFFVGWSQPSSGGSGTGGATIVGNNTTQVRENQTVPVQEPEVSSGSDGSGSSNGSGDLANSDDTLNDAESQSVKKSNTWLYIILILILILILCGVYYYFRVMKK